MLMNVLQDLIIAVQKSGRYATIQKAHLNVFANLGLISNWLWEIVKVYYDKSPLSMHPPSPPRQFYLVHAKKLLLYQYNGEGTVIDPHFKLGICMEGHFE